MKKNICVMACVFSLFLPIKPSSSNSNQYSCHKLEDSIEENEFQKSGRPSESILTYNDIFREYYDLVTYKLKKRNIDFNLPFSSFCENYYSSNLKLNEYVEFYSGSSSEFENEKSFSRTRSPLRSSGSKVRLLDSHTYIFRKSDEKTAVSQAAVLPCVNIHTVVC